MDLQSHRIAILILASLFLLFSPANHQCQAMMSLRELLPSYLPKSFFAERVSVPPSRLPLPAHSSSSASSSSSEEDGKSEDSSSSDANSNSASSEASGPSSSSEETAEESQEMHFLENVANWKPSTSHASTSTPLPSEKTKNCGHREFRHHLHGDTYECRQCSICGPDLYELEPCRANRDTRCEWCLSQWSLSTMRPGKLADFDAKCADLVLLSEEFRRILAGDISGKRGKAQMSGSYAPFHPKQSLLPGDSSIHISGVELISKNDRFVESWWKTEFAIQMAFYLSLCALALAILRFLCKARRPTERRTYRAVQVKALPQHVLDELDQKQIIRAAEAIRTKLGKKGYEKLDEEFI